PALARADVGIAMGALGSEAAIETADVVLMTDDPQSVVDALKTARRTNRIVWQNIALAFLVKLIVLSLGALGMATLWEAVFADVGVTILAVLNSTRIIAPKRKMFPRSV
ncbi:MAG: heavy metal translocating P-type ATPase, partial [Limnochordia bacterium]|nr:heavy metal translocating P-type ATPase [Limnochordia bacterium]